MITQIITFYRKYRSLAKLFLYDAKRYMDNSMILDKYKSQARLLGLIVARQHVIEKGLTMPEPRLGFGYENIMDLISLCKEYEKKYDVTHEQYISVISVLKEYLKFHNDRKYEIELNVKKQIDNIIQKHPNVAIHPQIRTTSSSFFNRADAKFDEFAKSRHTCRNYSDENISLDELQEIIELAQTAPSACNRQPIRVHICEKEIGQKVLKYHNGNRGFGNFANKVFIITADLSSYMNDKERNSAYVDGGIFTMNLLYALHFHRIGACVLNWSANIENDKNLRNVLSLPDQEEIVCLLTIGKLPEELSVANSERINIERIIRIHK